jgi:hypothetical protein
MRVDRFVAGGSWYGARAVVERELFVPEKSRALVRPFSFVSKRQAA